MSLDTEMRYIEGEKYSHQYAVLLSCLHESPKNARKYINQHLKKLEDYVLLEFSDVYFSSQITKYHFIDGLYDSYLFKIDSNNIDYIRHDIVSLNEQNLSNASNCIDCRIKSISEIKRIQNEKI